MVEKHDSRTRRLRKCENASAKTPSHRYHWDEVGAQTNAIRELITDYGWNWINAYELSILRADRHHARAHDHDCIHYCLPGPPDDWNRLWILELEHLAERDRGEAEKV
jgi:hypothetical protein